MSRTRNRGALLELWCKDRGVELVAEYRFHPKRRWRFDFAIPSHHVAIEIEGVSSRGKSRHTTISGYRADCEKYNAATVLGWRILRYTQDRWDAGDWAADLDGLIRL